MAEETSPKPYTLDINDKVSPVMIYTLNMVVRGEVVTKEQTRVSTWLRTQSAPEFIGLYNAQVLMFGTAVGIQQASFPEFYISAQEILAYHLVPPNQEPPDYDPAEPNRKMEPAVMLVGSFRFNGHLRLATQANVSKYLEIARETFFSMYDVEITNPGLPSTNKLKVPMVLARLSRAILAKSGV